MAAKTGAGLLLMVDEAGKALEYAAQQPTRGDVYLLQALAEVAARTSGVPFVILTVLHQSCRAVRPPVGSVRPERVVESAGPLRRARFP